MCMQAKLGAHFLPIAAPDIYCFTLPLNLKQLFLKKKKYIYIYYSKCFEEL